MFPNIPDRIRFCTQNDSPLLKSDLTEKVVVAATAAEDDTSMTQPESSNEDALSHELTQTPRPTQQQATKLSLVEERDPTNAESGWNSDLLTSVAATFVRGMGGGLSSLADAFSSVIPASENSGGEAEGLESESEESRRERRQREEQAERNAVSQAWSSVWNSAWGTEEEVKGSTDGWELDDDVDLIEPDLPEITEGKGESQTSNQQLRSHYPVSKNTISPDVPCSPPAPALPTATNLWNWAHQLTSTLQSQVIKIVA